MLKYNCILKNCVFAIMCISIAPFSGCIFLKTESTKSNSIIHEIKPETIAPGEVEEALANQEKTEDAPPDKKNEAAVSEEKAEYALRDTQDTRGSGYLSEGSAISLGIMDGDEELKVLKKISRLEARLKEERNKLDIQTKAFNKKLSDLQAAKDGVDKEFADTRQELEERNQDLLDKIKILESKLSETEARAVAAEQELHPIKKELLKAQISETKAQQELYKLKIDNLKQSEQ